MSKSFAELGLSPEVLKPLEDAGFKAPFPIQEAVIPLALTGVDIIGQAKTGTGKTLGFGLPILDLISQGSGKPLALVVVPTRELCIQVADELNKSSTHIFLIPIRTTYEFIPLLAKNQPIQEVWKRWIDRLTSTNCHWMIQWSNYVELSNDFDTIHLTPIYQSVNPIISLAMHTLWKPNRNIIYVETNTYNTFNKLAGYRRSIEFATIERLRHHPTFQLPNQDFWQFHIDTYISKNIAFFSLQSFTKRNQYTSSSLTQENHIELHQWRSIFPDGYINDSEPYHEWLGVPSFVQSTISNNP